MFTSQVPLEILKEKLSVPPQFWETWEATKKDCNGCGSGWNTKIVPDYIYRLNIRIVCCIHDRRYEIGGTEQDRKDADLEFLVNLLRVINNHRGIFYMHFLARKRALKYYEAVVRAGESAFNFKKESEV